MSEKTCEECLSNGAGGSTAYVRVISHDKLFTN